jgi:DNA invertase Pin-like site-specific DNA recombinase
MVGKRVQFDDETWEAIEAVIRDSGTSFQKLADEAFAGELKAAGVGPSEIARQVGISRTSVFRILIAA